MEPKDYRSHHQAPTREDGQALNALGADGAAYPPDVITHPEWYGAEYTTTIDLVKRANQLTTVQIYRAVPPGVSEISAGDWVALSVEYARVHSYGLLDSTVDDGSTDGVVLSAVVDAGLLFGEGNSLEEWGYDGPKITGLTPI